MKLISTFIFSILIFAFSEVHCQNWLDQDFGNGGLVIEDFGATSEGILSLAVQPDGKIIASGYKGTQLAVLRFNEDGSPDTTFGSSGIATATIGDIYTWGYAVTIKPDGKILTAGMDSDHDFILAQFTGEGTLDNTFGNSGIKTIHIGVSGEARAIALQSNGKIVVAGYATFNGDLNDFVVLRYNVNGSPDQTFGTSGKVITDIDGNGYAHSVVIQNDGKILVSGINGSRLTAARYNSNGTLDNSFADSGILTDTMLSSTDHQFHVALQADGKIVIGGGVGTDFAVVRYLTNGNRDPDFGVNGSAICNLGNDDRCNSINIQSDGKIVATGFIYGSNSNMLAGIARFNHDGSPDSTFGNDGIITTDLGEGIICYTPAGIVQPDGKILLGGYISENSITDYGMLRFLGSGTVGLSPLNNNRAFHLYPNPVNNVLTVQADAGLIKKNYSIVDASGRVVITGSLNPQVSTISLQNLSPGFYFLRTEGNFNVERLIKN